MNANNLFSTGYIAAQIKMSHDDTLKILSKDLGLKPYRETRVNGRMYRKWHKTSMYAAMQYVEEKCKKIEEQFNKESEPVQATLPLEPTVPVKQEEMPFKVPHPTLDITVMETKHAEEMLSILRSIDQRLYELTVIWSK